jgi:hypothetical protein
MPAYAAEKTFEPFGPGAIPSAQKTDSPENLPRLLDQTDAAPHQKRVMSRTEKRGTEDLLRVSREILAVGEPDLERRDCIPTAVANLGVGQFGVAKGVQHQLDTARAPHFVAEPE